MKACIIGVLALSSIVAACSNQVSITRETTRSGEGAAPPGGTGGSTSTGAPSGPQKLVTADSDIAQYQSFNTTLPSTSPIVQGPFFVTDAVAQNQASLFTVSGTDCSGSPTTVLTVWSGGESQFHGMKLPVLAGQSLCGGTNTGGTVTVLGFKPY